MPRTKRINIKLSDWAYEQVQELAEADGRSISSYCQRILERNFGDMVGGQQVAPGRLLDTGLPVVADTGRRRKGPALHKPRTKARTK